MEEPVSEDAPQGGNTSGDTPAAVEFKPITSQDDLNRVIDDRLKRERAKYADYQDVKAKASRLDELEAANKSEAEKVAERLAASEKAANDARRDALRFRIAAKFQVTDEDAELFLTGSDEDTLTRQAERLSARNAEAAGPRTPRPDPNQGRSPSAGPKSTADSFADFFRTKT
jgi:hypothetical protein